MRKKKYPKNSLLLYIVSPLMSFEMEKVCAQQI